MKPLLTVHEVAKQMKINPMTMYRLVKSHKIPAIRFGGSIRFSQEVINEWVEKNISQGKAEAK